MSRRPHRAAELARLSVGVIPGPREDAVEVLYRPPLRISALEVEENGGGPSNLVLVLAGSGIETVVRDETPSRRYGRQEGKQYRPE
jgi:hypothetical protein